MSELLKYLTPSYWLSLSKPSVSNKVKGMTHAFEKKAGVLFTTGDKNNSGAPKEPVSEDTYYEVTIQSSGENPEYPENLSHHFFTVANKSQGFVYQNGANCLAVGSRITKFVLEEEYDDGKIKPNVIFMGKRMPPHHMAMLRVHFVDAGGKKSQMGVGLAVRKSERESRAWQMAASCPVTYF